MQLIGWSGASRAQDVTRSARGPRDYHRESGRGIRSASPRGSWPRRQAHPNQRDVHGGGVSRRHQRADVAHVSQQNAPGCAHGPRDPRAPAPHPARARRLPRRPGGRVMGMGAPRTRSGPGAVYVPERRRAPTLREGPMTRRSVIRTSLCSAYLGSRCRPARGPMGGLSNETRSSRQRGGQDRAQRRATPGPSSISARTRRGRRGVPVPGSWWPR